MRRRLLCFASLLAASWLAASPRTDSLLSLFTDPKIPSTGPEEQPVPRTWPEPAAQVERPGQGLAQHPMLYAGEGNNQILLVDNGKVIWTFSAGQPGEIGDAWLLSNGHILFARQAGVEEVTAEKHIVWRYDAPQGTEVHTCQPIGLNKVLLIQNGLPPKLMVIDKRSNKVEVEHVLPAKSITDPQSVHPQFRRVRMTAKGTYLVPFLPLNKVVEYNKHFKAVWSYDIRTPWAAVRLHNGNTLITDEYDRLVREVDPEKNTVWEFRRSDLPANIILGDLQSADRLANGDTVILSNTDGTQPGDWPNLVQAVEVTADKKLVWVLQDWKDLGPATAAQFLDQAGRAEKPGDLER